MDFLAVASLTKAQLWFIFFTAGFILGFITAVVLFFRKKSIINGQLSWLQIGSVLMFFVYMLLASYLQQDLSEFVMIALIGIFGGESVGKVVLKGKEEVEKKLK